MSARPWLLLLGLFVARPAPASEAPVLPVPEKGRYRTPNFVVRAPTTRMAREVAEAAERCRREQARLWLGKELPGWSRRCEVRIVGGALHNGTTALVFYNGRVLRQSMELQGPSKDAIAHEVTHTVLASHFRCPVPRWADEGAALLSEGAEARQAWEGRLAGVRATAGRAIPLRRLLSLDGYPADLNAFYAQSHSLARFLVEARGRATFLAFVGDGLAGNWNKAVKAHYGYQDVDDLEKAWLKRQGAVKAP